jgi:Phage portal protein
LAIIDRVRSAWNAFIGLNTYSDYDLGYSGGTSSISYGGISPSRPRMRYVNDRSIVSSIFTRISIDVSGIVFKHIKVDENGLYEDDIPSNLNLCLNLEANLDQGPRAFRQDAILTLFDKGVAAIVPVDTTVNPNTNEVIDVYTLRVGEVVQWYPKHVRLSVYNEAVGYRQEVTLEKRFVAIVENPLFNVMNEPNSTLQRLIRKLNLLDIVDEQSSSGKLDLIIQLPYAIKSESRRLQAENRRTDIEFQLKGSQYGIAYTDATEKITQLNRPAENNLMGQIEYLIKMLYSQLGITEDVMNGTADEASMINYYNRTIKPVAQAMSESMQRAFIGHVGSAKLEKIQFFGDPFSLVPISQLAEVADKFTRNEILSSNEFRGIVGFAPSKDPKADELRNSNLPRADTGQPVSPSDNSATSNGKAISPPTNQPVA